MRRHVLTGFINCSGYGNGRPAAARVGQFS